MKAPDCWLRTPSFAFGTSRERQFAAEYVRELSRTFRRGVSRSGRTLRARNGRRARATFKLDAEGRLVSARVRSRRDGTQRVRISFPATIERVEPAPLCG